MAHTSATAAARCCRKHCARPIVSGKEENPNSTAFHRLTDCLYLEDARSSKGSLPEGGYSIAISRCHPIHCSMQAHIFGKNYEAPRSNLKVRTCLLCLQRQNRRGIYLTLVVLYNRRDESVQARSILQLILACEIRD